MTVIVVVGADSDWPLSIYGVRGEVVFFVHPEEGSPEVLAGSFGPTRIVFEEDWDKGLSPEHVETCRAYARAYG